MKFLLAILLLVVGAARAFEIRLQPNTNNPTAINVLFHGTISRNYSEMYCMGQATNYDYQGTLVDGPNYFAAAAFQMEGGVLEMSTFSNEITITNTPALDLQTVFFSMTNLGGSWTPWATNHLIIMPTEPARFFRSGDAVLVQTNIITFPHP